MNVRALDEIPELAPHLKTVWDTFMRLSGRRYSEGARIPIAELSAWLNEIGVTDQEERRYHFDLIDAMDAEFVSHCNKIRAQK